MEQHNKFPIREEVVLAFKDGLVYEAHTKNPKWDKEPWDPLEVTFNTIVFYENISGKKVIASYRENINESYIRKVVDDNKTPEEMKQLCLEVMVDLLSNDSARSWYKDKKFVVGETYDESVKDYFKENIDAHVDINKLKIDSSKIYKE